LRYFEDLAPQEISARVDMSAGAVRVALSRIRSALIECVRSLQSGTAGSHE
jgi:RNA polymerase sigma-70 factor, ECF subfamily